ncbi:Ribonuclease H1 [Yarrowia sp. C11]|nr:Ribonuclease H1 [Yarrowia sp. E02]KAG5369768.1 Ribonuclease H1 [Yarrowia sp. C11]
MKKYYAVIVGHRTGIYDHYEDAREQIRGYPGAVWKGFNFIEVAAQYFEQGINEHSYYVVEDLIFNDYTVAQNEANNRRIEGFRSLKSARECVLSGYREYYERFREDLWHTDYRGLKVWEVYTDGACSGNGQRNAIAGYGVFFGANNPLNICRRLEGSLQTNQRAELAAIKAAYQKIDSLNNGNYYAIYTDSRYALDCVLLWSYNWERYGWTNSRGQPVANKDLIQDILDLQGRRSCRNVVGLFKVEGHSGCRGNDGADELAWHGKYL